jgi:hypothetical protein
LGEEALPPAQRQREQQCRLFRQRQAHGVAAAARSVWALCGAAAGALLGGEKEEEDEGGHGAAPAST